MIPIPSALQGLDGPRPKQSGLGSGNGHRTIFGFGRRSSRNMLVALLPLVAAGPASAFVWATDSAADQGMCVSATIPGLCKQKLDALKVSQTGDIIIIRNDKIIFEWYAPGAGPAGSGHGRNTSVMGTWSSVTKSLIGATSMAYAYDHCGLRACLKLSS